MTTLPHSQRRRSFRRHHDSDWEPRPRPDSSMAADVDLTTTHVCGQGLVGEVLMARRPDGQWLLWKPGTDYMSAPEIYGVVEQLPHGAEPVMHNQHPTDNSDLAEWRAAWSAYLDRGERNGFRYYSFADGRTQIADASGRVILTTGG